MRTPKIREEDAKFSDGKLTQKRKNNAHWRIRPNSTKVPLDAMEADEF